MRQCLCICKQVGFSNRLVADRAVDHQSRHSSPVNLGRKIFKKRVGKKTSVKKGRAKDSRSCVEARGMAWQRRVDGGGGGARRVAMPLQGRAGTVALQWARADAHHSLAGRRGGRAREAGSGVRALVMTSRAGEFVGIGAQLGRACYSISLGCLLLPRWSWVPGSVRSGQKGIQRNHQLEY